MIRFDQLERLGVRAALMSDRNDGSMSLVHSAGAAAENRRRLFGAAGLLIERSVCASQVHGNRVHIVTETEAGCGSLSHDDALPDTDALATRSEGIPLAVSIADCCPILLFDPVRRAIAAIHAGRAGTLANVCGATVHAMNRAWACNPADIHAHIGPSAGPDRYEVAASMADEFRAAGLHARDCHIDLWESNRLQLLDAGLKGDRITCSRICTIADGGFYSYRRGDLQGRNIAVICI